MDIYLGIDIGTGSCKTCLLDSSGAVLGIASSRYTHAAEASQWKKQDPEAILHSVVEAVNRVILQSGCSAQSITALSIGCALHGLLAVDAQGRPLTNVFTWADDRAAPQAARVKSAGLADDLYRYTGCPAHGMYPLYKIIWLRENLPAVFEQTTRFISVKEYVLAQLCGEYRVDYSVASGAGLLDVHAHAWHPPALELAGIRSDQLSALAGPRSMLEVRNAALAERMGILPGTPVVLGASDAANSSLGAGAFSEHQATCMIGTSGAYRIITPRAYTQPNAGNWCYCVDAQHWLVGGAINNGGTALSWLRDVLQTVSDREIPFDALLAYAAQSPAGAGGVICLPFFLGERSPNWNLAARAAFIGLSAEHSLPHLCRAILEGVAFRLRSLDEMLASQAPRIREVRASGGFTQSGFWAQLVADVLGRPLSIPAEGETSCLGAAFWGHLALTPGSSFADLEEFVRVDRVFTPQSGNREVYDRRYGLYRELYDAISPMFGRQT